MKQKIVSKNINNSTIQMNGRSYGNNIVQTGKYLIDGRNRAVIIGGKTIAFLPEMTGRNIVCVNDHLIIDGYKLMPDHTWSNGKKQKKNFWSRVKEWFSGGN